MNLPKREICLHCPRRSQKYGKCPWFFWFFMDDHTTLSLLEELADRLGIPIRYEAIHDELTGLGGLCRIEGHYHLIIESKATADEKVQIMVEALRHFDLSAIYVRPALRELLERY